MDQIRTPPNPAESSAEQQTQEALSRQAPEIQPTSAGLPAEAQPEQREATKHTSQTTKESPVPTPSTPAPPRADQVVSNIRDQVAAPINPGEAVALLDKTDNDGGVINQANKVAEMFNNAVEQPDGTSFLKEAA